MTLQEQIAFFEKAKRYYSWWNIFKKGSGYGVCVFMLDKAESMKTTENYDLIRSLLSKYRTTSKSRSVFFENHKERRKAINQVLKDLKS
jgi:hypothetical protein